MFYITKAIHIQHINTKPIYTYSNSTRINI